MRGQVRCRLLLVKLSIQIGFTTVSVVPTRCFEAGTAAQASP